MAFVPQGAWQPATIELSIMAGESLKDVSFIGKMSPYVAVWIDPAAKQCTRVLSKVGRNPVWNDNISLPVHDAILYNPNSYLILQVHSEDLFSDSVVGTAYFPLYEVVRMRQQGGDEQGNIVSLRLQRPSGKTKGVIRFSVRIVGGNFPQWSAADMGPGDKGVEGGAMLASAPPADGIPVGFAVPPYCPPMAYPPAPYPPYAPDSMYGSSSSGQAPYNFPPGFGEAKPYYAPQQMPYYYPAPAAPPYRKRNGTSGWTIAAGLLGGLLLGDILF
eukprot:TRINITY_DN2355_c0_g1_i2.p2 TRINITY_DN2355_c0_g1~~TRINITY_DN2355_c0_g1_i2.p2  ORF type:complete len:273 (+),score=29.32 TRINITY_DN2355_c0_g1_i2:141-959(+)